MGVSKRPSVQSPPRKAKPPRVGSRAWEEEQNTEFVRELVSNPEGLAWLQRLLQAARADIRAGRWVTREELKRTMQRTAKRS